jgi:hypothetical protein
MNEQQTHWTEVNYSSSPTLTSEVQLRREIFELFLSRVDKGKLSKEAAISCVEQLTQTSQQAGRLALIDNPELSDSERK